MATWTTKQAHSDTVKASHINDLQTGKLDADGTMPLTGNWDAGSFAIRALTLQSDVATGTAPLTIASTTKVSNLNVDQADGYDFDQAVRTTDSPAFVGVSVANTSQVTCVGDSLTYGGGLTTSYPSVLGTTLGSTWVVNNRGISGETSTQIRNRFSSDVVLPGDCKYVIILAGTNDVANDVAAVDIEANLQAMYSAAAGATPAIGVIAITIPPQGATAPRQAVLDAVNAWIAATATDIDYVVDAYALFNDSGNPGNLLAAYDSGDGIHPNAAGYALLAATIYAAATWTPTTTQRYIRASRDNVYINQNLRRNDSPQFNNVTANIFLTDVTNEAVRVGYQAGEDYVPSGGGSVTAIGYQAGRDCTTGTVMAMGKGACLKTTTGIVIGIGDGASRDATTGTVTGIGYNAALHATSGYVTAIGYQAGYTATSGNLTAIGYWAGFYTTIGAGTCIGAYAGLSTTTAHTTAVGTSAGASATTNNITAIGYSALNLMATGNGTAVGYEAGLNATSGSMVAVGHQAGYTNSSSHMVSVGFWSGYSNSSGQMVSVGYMAGYGNTTGNMTAVGFQAGMLGTSNSTLIGYQAGQQLTTGEMICIGYGAGLGATATNAPVTDSNGILVGYQSNRSVVSATELSNYIGIGYQVLIDKSNQVKIGNSSITENIFYGNFGIGGATSWGTSATKTLAVPTGTDPSSSPADCFQMYSSDEVAGNAVPTFRTEEGVVVKLNQSLLDTDSVIFGTSAVRGTTGGLVLKTAEATANITAATSVTITLNVPTGAIIHGCQLRVDAALAAGETWNAAYSGGSPQTIIHEGAVAANTKYNSAYESLITAGTLAAQAAWAANVATAATNITIQRHSNPGVDSFTAQGTIRAIVYYYDFTAMANA